MLWRARSTLFQHLNQRQSETLMVTTVVTKETGRITRGQKTTQVESLVTHFSDPNDLVVDPCAGSFTTAIACLRHNRRFIGCDVDPAYIEIGLRRLADERVAHRGESGTAMNVQATGDEMTPQILRPSDEWR
jgi:hypothetical protein